MNTPESKLLIVVEQNVKSRVFHWKFFERGTDRFLCKGPACQTKQAALDHAEGFVSLMLDTLWDTCEGLAPADALKKMQ